MTNNTALLAADPLRATNSSRLKRHQPNQISTDSAATLLSDCVKKRIAAAKLVDVDERDCFEVNEESIQSRAVKLAELHYLAINGDCTAIQSLTVYEPLLKRIGRPGPSVRNLRRWFTRAILRDERQITDYAAHVRGDIGSRQIEIISRQVLGSRRRQLRGQMKFAGRAEIRTVGSDGQRIALPFNSVWNTAHKRSAKNYVRLKGLESFCLEQDLVGFFVTLTLPPSFHPNPKSGMSSWDGATPHDGHVEMQNRWRRFQRRFGKLRGVRVEEQHGDGCVHWHALMWVHPARETEFRAKIQTYFGASPASDVTPINAREAKIRGVKPASGATYLMKYLLSTTAHETPTGQASKTAQRADAHRATWGGRAIQFFDVPGSSTIWDEIRRVKPQSDEFSDLSESGRLLHAAATGNDYATFLGVLARLRFSAAGERERRVELLYGIRNTGVRYLRGLVLDHQAIDTHVLEWELVGNVKCVESLPQIDTRTVKHSYPSNSRELRGDEQPDTFNESAKDTTKEKV